MFKFKDNICKSVYKPDRKGIKSGWFIKKQNKESNLYTYMFAYTHLQHPF